METKRIEDVGLPTIVLNDDQYREYIDNMIQDYNNYGEEKKHDVIMSAFIINQEKSNTKSELLNLNQELIDIANELISEQLESINNEEKENEK